MGKLLFRKSATYQELHDNFNYIYLFVDVDLVSVLRFDRLSLKVYIFIVQNQNKL